MKRLFCTLVLAGIVISSLFADNAAGGFYFDQGFQATYDPLGAQFVSQLYYRLPLVKSEGILWESTKIDMGLINNLSPGYDLAGVFVDIAPIAFFDLALSAQFAGYFSALGFGFTDLSGYDAPFDTASIAQITQRNAAGYVLKAAPTLKFALGPFAALDVFNSTYFNADNVS